MFSLRHFGPAGGVRGYLTGERAERRGEKVTPAKFDKRIVIQLFPLPSKSSFLKYGEVEVFLCAKTGKRSADSVFLCVCVHVFVFVIFSGLMKHGVCTGTAQQFPR